MEVIKDFKIEQIPVHKIVFVVTSDQDYSMERVIFAESYPDYNNYTIIHGGHCSCYGFEETEWEAITYTEDELLKVLKGWVKSSYEEETIASLITRYLEVEDD